MKVARSADVAVDEGVEVVVSVATSDGERGTVTTQDVLSDDNIRIAVLHNRYADTDFNIRGKLQRKVRDNSFVTAGLLVHTIKRQASWLLRLA
jgi:hypothetical protein